MAILLVISSSAHLDFPRDRAARFTSLLLTTFTVKLQGSSNLDFGSNAFPVPVKCLLYGTVCLWEWDREGERERVRFCFSICLFLYLCRCVYFCLCACVFLFFMIVCFCFCLYVWVSVFLLLFLGVYFLSCFCACVCVCACPRLRWLSIPAAVAAIQYRRTEILMLSWDIHALGRKKAKKMSFSAKECYSDKGFATPDLLKLRRICRTQPNDWKRKDGVVFDFEMSSVPRLVFPSATHRSAAVSREFPSETRRRTVGVEIAGETRKNQKTKAKRKSEWVKKGKRNFKDSMFIRVEKYIKIDIYLHTHIHA